MWRRSREKEKQKQIKKRNNTTEQQIQIAGQLSTHRPDCSAHPFCISASMVYVSSAPANRSDGDFFPFTVGMANMSQRDMGRDKCQGQDDREGGEIDRERQRKREKEREKGGAIKGDRSRKVQKERSVRDGLTVREGERVTEKWSGSEQSAEL